MNLMYLHVIIVDNLSRGCENTSFIRGSIPGTAGAANVVPLSG